MLRAFSHLARLRILHLLQRGERSLDDICKILQISPGEVCRHLAYLRKAGLVVSRLCGHRAFYTLAPAKSALQEKAFACLASCFIDLPEIQKDVAASGGLGPSTQTNTSDCCTFASVSKDLVKSGSAQPAIRDH